MAWMVARSLMGEEVEDLMLFGRKEDICERRHLRDKRRARY